MAATPPTLHMLCGKIASGKSTLAARLGAMEGTVVISEDDWLAALYSDRMATIADYLSCAANLRQVMAPHVETLLRAGVSVVLDFPANTVETRAWMRAVIERTRVAHQLHLLQASDAQCLERLRRRNEKGHHPFAATEAQFHRVTAHFSPPTPDEGFHIVLHDAAL